MSADFGYINARIRGLKAKLLGPEFYGEALNATDFKAFSNSLAQSAYMRDMEEAQSRHQGLAMVDDALARNFYRTTQSILNFSDGEPRELIAKLLLRYDLANLKAIVRAKHAGRDFEDIRAALFPAGMLKLSVLEHIAAAQDIPGVAQALALSGHPLAQAFGKAASRYVSEGDLYKLELSLDRSYYQVLQKELSGLAAPQSFVRHIQREIDATNLRTILKMRGNASAADSLFILGGKEIRHSTFEALLLDSSPTALQVLQTTSFAKVAEANTLSEAEEEIRAIVDQSAKRLAWGDPLDIGVVLNYLRNKEAETAKLRLLARGKYYGVPRAELERELGHA